LKWEKKHLQELDWPAEKLPNTRAKRSGVRNIYMRGRRRCCRSALLCSARAQLLLPHRPRIILLAPPLESNGVISVAMGYGTVHICRTLWRRRCLGDECDMMRTGSFLCLRIFSSSIDRAECEWPDSGRCSRLTRRGRARRGYARRACSTRTKGVSLSAPTCPLSADAGTMRRIATHGGASPSIVGGGPVHTSTDSRWERRVRIFLPCEGCETASSRVYFMVLPDCGSLRTMLRISARAMRR